MCWLDTIGNRGWVRKWKSWKSPRLPDADPQMVDSPPGRFCTSIQDLNALVWRPIECSNSSEFSVSGGILVTTGEAMWSPTSPSLTRFAPDSPPCFPPGMDSDTAAYALPTHVASSVLCLEAEKGAARKRSSHMAMAWKSGNRHRHSFLNMYIDL